MGIYFFSNKKHDAKKFTDLKLRINNAIYNEHTYYLNEKELLAYHDWTPETIVHRGEKIINSIVEYWKIPHPGISNFYQSFLGN